MKYGMFVSKRDDSVSLYLPGEKYENSTREDIYYVWVYTSNKGQNEQNQIGNVL